jgi:predicted RND superfamily exporter protein
VWAAVIIFIPLLIGKAITMAFMGYGGIGFFIYTLPVITLGFGLGIDFSLYILARLKEEISATGDFEKGYIKALGTSGHAVLFTGLTMTGGLITLLLSQMRFQAILGSMLSVVVMANTIIALLFFPVLLSVLRPKFLFRKDA